MEDGWVMLTSADRGDDVRSILYGLSLRNIPARAEPSDRRGGDPFLIVVPTSHLDRARAAVGPVWDALFDTPRAVNPDGTCPFCGYRVLGLPKGAPCPECGTDLDSIPARRAHRDGRTHRTKPNQN